MLQIYYKDDKAKRGPWSSPRVIPSNDRNAGSIVEFGRGRKRVTAVVGDKRAVRDDDSLITAVQSATDKLDLYIDDVLEVFLRYDDNDGESYSLSTYNHKSDCDFSSSKPTRPSTSDRVEVF